MINSLKYAKQLEEVGLTREQAEAHMQIITEVMETHFAMKQDIKDLESRMDFRFQDLEARLELRFQDLANRIKESEYRMTIKLGTIVSLAIGVAVTLTKLV